VYIDPGPFTQAQVVTFILFAIITGVGIFGTTKIYKERQWSGRKIDTL